LNPIPHPPTMPVIGNMLSLDSAAPVLVVGPTFYRHASGNDHSTITARRKPVGNARNSRNGRRILSHSVVVLHAKKTVKWALRATRRRMESELSASLAGQLE
jgi:hypothetical protein